MPDDLTDDERTLLVNMLMLEIEGSKFPLSQRVESLKRIRAKLTGEPHAASSSPAAKQRR